MSTEITTTMRDEIVSLAVRLRRAGIPDADVAAEFMAIGAGILQELLGSDATAERLEAAAERLRNTAVDLEPKH